MRRVLERLIVGVAMICGMAPAQVHAGYAIGEGSLRKAPDGKATGWMLEVPWPDQDDASQAWRKIETTLVIAEDGKELRNIERNSFVNWNFWHGGREVVFGSSGALSGSIRWERMDVRSGKVLARWTGDSQDKNAPRWVRAADAD